MGVRYRKRWGENRAKIERARRMEACGGGKCHEGFCKCVTNDS